MDCVLKARSKRAGVSGEALSILQQRIGNGEFAPSDVTCLTDARDRFATNIFNHNIFNHNGYAAFHFKIFSSTCSRGTAPEALIQVFNEVLVVPAVAVHFCPSAEADADAGKDEGLSLGLGAWFIMVRWVFSFSKVCLVSWSRPVICLARNLRPYPAISGIRAEIRK